MFFETEPESKEAKATISNETMAISQHQLKLKFTEVSQEQDEKLINSSIQPMGFNSEIDHKRSVIYNEQRNVNFVKIYTQMQLHEKYLSIIQEDFATIENENKLEIFSGFIRKPCTILSLTRPL